MMGKYSGTSNDHPLSQQENKITKTEIQRKVLKNGKPLSQDLFSWCENTRTFSSSEYGLVINFTELGHIIINASFDCEIKAGYHCKIRTSSNCKIWTGYHCEIKSSFNCKIWTGSKCIIETDSHCTIVARESCVVQTKLECVLVRRDIHQVIELIENQTIQLNDCGIKGYRVINDDQYNNNNNNNRKKND